MDVTCSRMSGRQAGTLSVAQLIHIYDPETDQTFEVHLIEVKGDQVRLGIVAPRSVAVDRSEIAALKQAVLPVPLPAVPVR